MAFTLPSSTRPFAFDRAGHVGSFLRPQDVLDARDAWKKGTLNAMGLRVVEDREIEKLIEEQRVAGIKSISDGEFR